MSIVHYNAASPVPDQRFRMKSEDAPTRVANCIECQSQAKRIESLEAENSLLKSELRLARREIDIYKKCIDLKNLPLVRLYFLKR